MEILTSLEQLQEQKEFHYIEDGWVKSYTFLCIHPKNNNYILAINHTTQNADKFYIPDMMGETTFSWRNIWCGKYDGAFIYEELRKYHQDRADKCAERRDYYIKKKGDKV